MQQAVEQIDQHGERPRITLSRAASGECHFVLKTNRGKIVWQETGGSFEQCCHYFNNFSNFVGTETVEAGDRKYAWLVTVKNKPQWHVEFAVKPLCDPNQKPEKPAPITAGEIARFKRQFTDRLKAGQSIIHALTVLARQQRNEHLEWVLTRISADLESGMPFVEAMARQPKIFDQEYINIWKDIDLHGLDLQQAIQALRGQRSR